MICIRSKPISSDLAKVRTIWFLPGSISSFIDKVSKHRPIGLSVAQPEGIATEYNAAMLIDVSAGETYEGTMNVSFPADSDLVPGSPYVQLTAIGKLQPVYIV